MARKSHPARLLAALELLQAHGRTSGADLARRLEVDRRTVRRYIVALEDMGVPVTTERGPAGGYALVAGYRVPPLMFTEDEAVAVSLGLAAVRGYSLLGGARAVESAQAKLERVMPERVRGRVRAVTESVAFLASPQPPVAAGTTFGTLSAAAHERRGVRLAYRAPSGATVREVDPYGLAFVRGHWYAVGFCHLRKDVRSFRLDRVGEVAASTRHFTRPPGFDAVAHLRTSISTLPRRFSVDVLLHTDLASASARLMTELGVLEAEGPAVRLRSEVDDVDWFARELAHLPWRFAVRQPPSLADALARHARALQRQARRAAPARSAAVRRRRPVA